MGIQRAVVDRTDFVHRLAAVHSFVAAVHRAVVVDSGSAVHKAVADTVGSADPGRATVAGPEAVAAVCYNLTVFEDRANASHRVPEQMRESRAVAVERKPGNRAAGWAAVQAAPETDICC